MTGFASMIADNVVLGATGALSAFVCGAAVTAFIVDWVLPLAMVLLTFSLPPLVRDLRRSAYLRGAIAHALRPRAQDRRP